MSRLHCSLSATSSACRSLPVPAGCLVTRSFRRAHWMCLLVLAVVSHRGRVPGVDGCGQPRRHHSQASPSCCTLTLACNSCHCTKCAPLLRSSWPSPGPFMLGGTRLGLIAPSCSVYSCMVHRKGAFEVTLGPSTLFSQLKVKVYVAPFGTLTTD